jgi:hypothetical protein
MGTMRRAIKIYNQISELCTANNTVEFDITVSIENEAYFILKEDRIPLSKLNLSILDIQHVLDFHKIVRIREYWLKELATDELYRHTYSLYITLEVDAPEREPKFLRFGHYIALCGGLMITLLGIYMEINQLNLVGYDTHFGGGYSYKRLTGPGIILIGAILLFMGISGLKRQR